LFLLSIKVNFCLFFRAKADQLDGGVPQLGWMDPRIGWCTPEQQGRAHEFWSRIWEAQLGLRSMNLNNANPNLDQKAQEFIPLDYDNKLNLKHGPSNRHQQYLNEQYHKRKRDNKASTYWLNHSSNAQILEHGGMTPWIPVGKKYIHGVIG
jgi:hypothetical protein